MADLLPEKTVIVTNSSTLLPSKFAKYTKRQKNIYHYILQIVFGKII